MEKPWEKPRVKRILELFDGKVVKIDTGNIHREVKVNEAEIPR